MLSYDVPILHNLLKYMMQVIAIKEVECLILLDNLLWSETRQERLTKI